MMKKRGTVKGGFPVVMLIGAVCWLLMCAAAQAASAEDPSIRVVSPPDKSWVTEQKVSLAGVVAAADVTQVIINGVDTDAKKGAMPVEGGAFGSLISLDKGENVITLTAGKLVTRLTVYYAPLDSKQAKKVPAGFQRFFTHQKPTALNCKECHRFKRGKYDFKRLLPARSNCTSCHTKMAEAKHVHGPVGAGVCISCHNPHGSFDDNHLERSGPDLCLVCHQAKKEEFDQPVVHPPVAEGCVDCHDPHQSPMRFQLRGDGSRMSSLCFRCHEDAIFTKEHRHGPVGSGDCIACHRPHAGKYEKLLIAPPAGGELCFTCHQDRKEEFTMSSIHPPVEEDCNNCHDPHSAPARFQLHKAVPELCAECHEDLHEEVYKDITTGQYQHPPVAEGSCTACHRPHSSNYDPLLKDSMEKLCFTCHIDLSDQVSESANRHGPVKTGDCTACHKPHGSENSRLLLRYFPANFYTEYGLDDYALCFGCHNKDIAKTKYTKTLTNFRDGEYNLHFFHVNRKKGRTCIACHDPHASNQSKHVRYEVPFGAWSYPIELTKTEVGGTCVVGCHAPKTYDRKNPKVKPSR